jgi:hypothetical protein
LGFHPELVENKEKPHNAFMKGTTSRDVAVVAQTGKGFPSAKLTAYYTAYDIVVATPESLPQHMARQYHVVHTSQHHSLWLARQPAKLPPSFYTPVNKRN